MRPRKETEEKDGYLLSSSVCLFGPTDNLRCTEADEVSDNTETRATIDKSLTASLMRVAFNYASGDFFRDPSFSLLFFYLTFPRNLPCSCLACTTESSDPSKTSSFVSSRNSARHSAQTRVIPTMCASRNSRGPFSKQTNPLLEEKKSEKETTVAAGVFQAAAAATLIVFPVVFEYKHSCQATFRTRKQREKVIQFCVSSCGMKHTARRHTKKRRQREGRHIKGL